MSNSSIAKIKSGKVDRGDRATDRETLRKRYRPARVRLLFVGEANSLVDTIF